MGFCHEDGSVKPRQGTLMLLIHGPFGPVFPVHGGGRVIMFLSLKASSFGSCTFLTAPVAEVFSIGIAGILGGFSPCFLGNITAGSCLELVTDRAQLPHER